MGTEETETGAAAALVGAASHHQDPGGKWFRRGGLYLPVWIGRKPGGSIRIQKGCIYHCLVLPTCHLVLSYLDVTFNYELTIGSSTYASSQLSKQGTSFHSTEKKVSSVVFFPQGTLLYLWRRIISMATR
ncbi:hypothetical protein PVAP13_4NG233400 [Panicum virgatum]|uniref:Uncharacterized protein n=1 Tax=Panicum virgatum TaxID=38727 RepID=A0A8T0TAH0_PANVG|nr:hypothetical protein PVAP13_4NG233400 [Panicum virgatum]